MTFDQQSGGFEFTWDATTDVALLRVSGREFWRGSLLPLFWVADEAGGRVALQATLRGNPALFGDGRGVMEFELGDAASGRLVWAGDAQQFRITRLELEWRKEPRRIVGMYFGCALLTAEQRRAVPTLERPFWPNWRALGFAVPGAKTAPMQSFFRRWDFGHTNIALGSFGPAMGTPYGAAFPRPTFAAGMGDDDGVVVLGAGEIPDAALTLQVRASSGCLEWLYREDLWGAPTGKTRVWTNPLWLTWDATAWHAYRRYFRSLPQQPRDPEVRHQKSFMGTWGDFRRLNFELSKTVDRAVDDVGGELLCIDDPWESFEGSGEPHPERLPNFEADLEYARSRGLGIGIWQPTLWVANYEQAGLTPDDLLRSVDGPPVLANWALDPHDPEKLAYCLEPSSPRAIAYLTARTRRIMERYRPTLLKLDFSYGGPGPDATMPRDPQWRGERGPWRLMRAIVETAKAIDPRVTILGYSLSPLWDAVQDQLSLDDLGDAGPYEAEGHCQWSVWASLVADRGMAIMASSGYDWDVDAEILLNTAVLGAPGMNLPRVRPDGTPPSRGECERRKALTRCFRRDTRWTPLWLDTSCGGFMGDPRVRSWGRLETANGGQRLTALSLRRPTAAAQGRPELRGIFWSGAWALVSQDDRDIFTTSTLLIIAVESGQLQLPHASSGGELAGSRATVTPLFGGQAPRWSWADGAVHVTVDLADPGTAVALLVEYS